MIQKLNFQDRQIFTYHHRTYQQDKLGCSIDCKLRPHQKNKCMIEIVIWDWTGHGEYGKTASAVSKILIISIGHKRQNWWGQWG